MEVRSDQYRHIGLALAMLGYCLPGSVDAVNFSSKKVEISYLFLLIDVELQHLPYLSRSGNFGFVLFLKFNS